MANTELAGEYFDWMYSLVFGKNRSYRKLLVRLHEIPFRYSIPMDGNREADGINLRYRFGYENGYADYIIADELDHKKCSVLEMMIALCIRCEEQIMDDPEVGNRTGKWFFNMLKNLGLHDMDDRHFEADYIDRIMLIFLNRKYQANGRGGLFTVHTHQCDMRSIEIWYQMCWYLDELLSEKGRSI